MVVDVRDHMFAALGKKLVALVEDHGDVRVLWEYETGGQIPGSPALGEDGLVRVHSGDGFLHCVNDAGGQEWSPVAVGQPLSWASPIVDAKGNAWICSYSGGLLKVEADGTRKRAPYFRSRQKFDSTGLIHNGVFYVGAEDGFIYAISLAGSRGKNLFKHTADKGKTDWFINSAPALTADPALVVAGRDEHLYAFAMDGTQLWRLHIRGQMLASPVVDSGGDVYVGVSLIQRGQPDRGKLVCVDGESRRTRWEYDAKAAVESTPIIGSDGNVYFGDNAGVIHAVDQNGIRLWSRNVGSPVRSAGTIAAPRRLVFGLDDGTLVGVLCSTTSVATGGWPKYLGPTGSSKFGR